ncbi:MAG: hypothetical protein H6Q90_842 [Deltaproteobacteria bacterium]|nr:hypothetical protein [Deltaproteobacteria bacterium]
MRTYLLSLVLGVAAMACDKSATQSQPATTAASGSSTGVRGSDTAAPAAAGSGSAATAAGSAASPASTAGSASGSGAADPGPVAASKDLFKLGDREQLAEFDPNHVPPPPNPGSYLIGGHKVALAIIDSNDGAGHQYVELRADAQPNDVTVLRLSTCEACDNFVTTDGGAEFVARNLKKLVPGVGPVYAGTRYRLAWDATTSAPIADAMSTCDDEQTAKVRKAGTPICDEPARWTPLLRADGQCCCKSEGDAVHYSWDKPATCFGPGLLGECVATSLCKK